MLTRAPWMIVVVSLFVLGGGSIVADTAPARAVAASRKPAFACHGIDRGEVRGLDPAYTNKRLASFRNHKRVCGGLWLPPPRRYLVPQGLALDGGAAWVSGFRYRAGYGQRPCRLRRVSLVTGRQLAYHGVVYGRVGARPRSYCRHGGGILKRGEVPLDRGEEQALAGRPVGHAVGAQRPPGAGGSSRRCAVRRSSPPARASGSCPSSTSGGPSIYWFRFKQLRNARSARPGGAGAGRPAGRRRGAHPGAHLRAGRDARSWRRGAPRALDVVLRRAGDAGRSTTRLRAGCRGAAVRTSRPPAVRRQRVRRPPLREVAQAAHGRCDPLRVAGPCSGSTVPLRASWPLGAGVRSSLASSSSSGSSNQISAAAARQRTPHPPFRRGR